MRHVLLTALFLIYCSSVVMANDDDVESINTPKASLQLTSTADLEKELASRNTREKRIETTEVNLKKLVNRKSVKKAVIGSVLTGAITAHPVGLLVGGLVGAFVGRSEKYDKVEEKIAEMEQEIIVDEDDFLTDEEVRLANFASGNETVVTVFEDPEKGVFDDSEIAATAPPMEDYRAPQPTMAATANNMPKITVANTPAANKMNSANNYAANSNATIKPQAAVPSAVQTTQPPVVENNEAVFGGAQVASLTMDSPQTASEPRPKASLESCYKSADAKPSNQSRRQEIKAMSHCFYMMY
jgi:hypothetical protein